MSRNRVSHGRLTTDVSPTIPKVKKRPRGRPFEKGNTLSLPYRFKKGAPSPNPGGRPKSRQFNVAARKFAGADVNNLPKIETVADAVIATGVRKARKGDLGWATFLANRAEGLPVQGLSIQNENDPLQQLADAMKARWKQTGPPENFVPRQKVLEASNDAHE